MSSSLRMTLQEILLATNEFAEANKIGKGGFGTVYRGQSEQHGMLAIKRLNRVFGQGDHEYGMEISLLSKYKHENLVSLIGFCGENDEKILVYKYEANQSLDKFLHSKELSWMRRLEICLGAARGLRYLHSQTGSEHGVIHRDIKSSNILLDENWNAKISDVGLSRIALTDPAISVIFTSACGTPGYVDPEYLQDGTLTQKSDVYSFGVVLYEVLFGMVVGRARFTVKQAKKHFENKTLHMMIDQDLIKEMNTDSLSKFSTIAYQCLKKRREDRPTMSLVVEALEEALGTRQNFRLPSSTGLLHDVYISLRDDKSLPPIVVNRLNDFLEKEGLSHYSRDGIYPVEAIRQSRNFREAISKFEAANAPGLDLFNFDYSRESPAREAAARVKRLLLGKRLIRSHGPLNVLVP